MALPPIEIDVRADTAQAEAGLARVGNAAQTAGVKTGAGAAAATKGVGRLGSASGAMRGQVQNASFQLQDMVVQLQMGTRWTTVMAQQLPQLAGGFGAVGAAVGLLAAVGFTALGFAMAAFNDDVVENEEALEDFVSALNRVNGASDIAGQSIAELREEYGIFAEQVQMASRIVAQAALADAMREFDDVAKSLRPALGGVSDAMADYAREVENANIVQRTLGERTVSNASAWDEADAAVDRARASLVDAAGEMGLTVGQAESLQRVLENMATAEGPEEIARQAGLALAEFDKMFTSAQNIPPEIAKAIAELRTMQTEAARAAEGMDELRLASAGMTFGTALDPSGGLLPPSGDGEADTGGGGRVRSGGGRAAPVDTTGRDLEALEKQLMTETEMIQSTYADRHELLLAAREQELLTEEEYKQRLLDIERDKNDKLAAMDAYRYGTGLDRTQKFFSDTAAAFAGGNEKLVAIGQKFAKVEALINAGRAFAQVAADPSLPWYAKIPAAVGVASAISSFANSAGIGSGSSAAGAASAAQQQAPQQEVTTFSFTLQNDSFGFGESFARQMIEQINSAQRDGGRVQAVLT